MNSKLSSRRGIGKIALVLVLAVVLGVAGTLSYFGYMSYAFQRRVLAIKTAGHPIRVSEFNKKNIPEEENGATYLLQRGSRILAIDKEFEQICKEINAPLTDETLAKYDKLMVSYSGVFRVTEAASNCKVFAPKMREAHEEFQRDNESYSKAFSRAARPLHHRSRVALHRGESELAAKSAIEILKISRLAETQPGLIGYQSSLVVRDIGLDICNRVLQETEMSDEHLEQLEAVLKDFEPRNGMRWSLISERAIALDSATKTRYKLGDEFLDFFESELSDIGSDYYEIIEKRDARPKPVDSSLTMNLRKGIDLVYLQDERIQAKERCLSLLIKIKKSKATTIEAVSEVGKNEYLDPFSGKELLVAKLDDGWMVRSVGPNLKDDFDNKILPDDIGLGPQSVTIERGIEDITSDDEALAGVGNFEGNMKTQKEVEEANEKKKKEREKAENEKAEKDAKQKDDSEQEKAGNK